MSEDSPDLPHVVIVGGGFGGLNAAKALASAPVRVTLVDRTNHHLFQPLLYQVAMAGLSPAEIAAPIRSIVGGQPNTTVLLAEVRRVDLVGKRVVLDDRELPYNYLILAAGAENSFFGHSDWEKHAPGLKRIEDALEIRRRVLDAFETAEREADATQKNKLLTFVVIGGGPTGVELAGALAELSRHVLAEDFHAIKPKEARIVIVEAGERLLPAMPTDLSQRAREQLEELGVEVKVGSRVMRIDAGGVVLESESIAAETVLWAAGVKPTPLAASLGVPLDKQGRVVVGSDASIPGHPEVFVIGDMAHFEQDGEVLPGLCPVAMQGGRAVAGAVVASVKGEEREPFRYWDKGTMATIGRSRAVARAGRLHMSGFLAWLAWLSIHIIYLIGFKNRLVVLLTWAWSYFTYKRGARLITAQSWKPAGDR
jgi:NADH dehydrogenase